MAQKVIIIEPDKCDESCDKVKNVFAEDLDGGAVFITSVNDKEGAGILKALKIKAKDLKKPMVIVVSDAEDIEALEDVTETLEEVQKIAEDAAEDEPEEIEDEP